MRLGNSQTVVSRCRTYCLSCCPRPTASDNISKHFTSTPGQQFANQIWNNCILILHLLHFINNVILYCWITVIIKRLILGCSPPLWDNWPDSLIMAWGPEARRTLLGWKADYLIMAASNQVINVFNTNALRNQIISVDPNVLSPFHVFVVFSPQ